MEVANEADQGISSLAELADRIGTIVHMINGIAEQTNMLALNATIEAARAGEAGRSFAVVASEVKTLAGQTAKATEEISQQINSIQSATHGAVGLIRTISQTVSEIQGRTTAIAAAVEEQEASTHEISRSISLASSGSGRVASDVTAMASSVEKTSDEANQLRITSDKLAEVAGELSRSVESFLEGVTRDVADRRSATRHASREVVLILKDTRRISSQALDVSETGLRIECDMPMRVNESIQIEFLNGERCRAIVAWCANGQAGLKLEQRIPQLLVEALAA
jgi:methyl-accepting chemotaxis protein